MKRQISEEVVKGLAKQIAVETNNQVKEVIAAAIGGVGLPEGLPCLSKLLQVIKGNNSKKQVDP
jgi:hypothetical protein